MDTKPRAKETPERRRFPRYNVNLQASLGLKNECLLRCAVIDISLGGLRVVSRKYFAPNTVLIGDLALSNQEQCEKLLRYCGVAKHSRLEPTGMSMGVEFCVLAPSSKTTIRRYIEDKLDKPIWFDER